MGKNLIIVVVAVLLAYTNPEKGDFVQFLNQEISKSMDETAPELGKEAKSFASGLMAVAIDKSTEQKDYVVFSVLKVDTSFLRLFSSEIPDLKFIGIAGQFIPYGKTLDFLQQVKNKPSN